MQRLKDFFWPQPELRPERWVLAAGLVFGILFVFLIPPMQGGDEPNHFMRAYQIAGGDLRSDYVRTSLGGIVPYDLAKPLPLTKSGPNNVGGRIPKGLIDFNYAAIGDIPAHPDQKFNPRTLKPLFHYKIGSQSEQIAFANTSAYSPAAYLPDLPAIWLGRLLGGRPLVMMYLARLFGLVFGVALIALAIRLLPFGKLPAAVIALLPMTIGEMSVITVDVAVFAYSFLAVALILHYSFSKKALSRRQIAYILGAVTLASLAKPILFPISLLTLALLQNPKILRATAWKIIGGSVALALVTTFGWGELVQKAAIFGYNATYPGVNFHAQLHYVTTEPLSFVGVFYRTFFTENFNVTATSFIGNLGWLDTSLPPFAVISGYILIGLATAFTAFSELPKPPRPTRLLLLCIAALVTLATFTASYLYFIPVRGSWDDGLQGRYFIPIALLLLTGLIAGPSLIRRREYNVLARRCLVASVLLLLIMTTKLVLRYYL
jgi:uncharacterized membrane protein